MTPSASRPFGLSPSERVELHFFGASEVAAASGLSVAAPGRKSMQALLAADGDYAIENGVLQNGHVSIRIEAAHPAVMLPETLLALTTTMRDLLNLPKPKSRNVLPLCGWMELHLTVPGMAAQVCRSFLCGDEFSSDHWVTTRRGIVRNRYIVSVGQ